MIISQQNLSCPLCESKAELKLKNHLGYQITKSYDIYHCKNCSTAFANPLKVDETIYDFIYSKIETIPGYSRYYTYANQVLLEEKPLDYLAKSEDVYWSIREFLKSKNSRSFKILEIGCGFGYLTYALKKAGYDIQGTDISEEAVSQASKRYGNLFFYADIKIYAKETTQKYDVIILTEVIEHIQDIKGFLTAVNDLLIPDGSIVLTTPNKSIYPKDVLWETEPPPVHLWWFSEDSIKILGSMFDYQVSFIDFFPYNLQEINRFKYYSRPYTLIRNFQCSRLSRLDENGNVIKNLVWIYPDKINESTEPKYSSIKIKIKKFLNSISCLEEVIKLKKNILKLKEFYHVMRIKRDLKKDSNKSRRITMCAILQKNKIASH